MFFGIALEFFDNDINNIIVWTNVYDFEVDGVCGWSLSVIRIYRRRVTESNTVVHDNPDLAFTIVIFL